MFVCVASDTLDAATRLGRRAVGVPCGYAHFRAFAEGSIGDCLPANLHAADGVPVGPGGWVQMVVKGIPFLNFFD